MNDPSKAGRQPAAIHRDILSCRQEHPDHVKYQIYVFWICGLSAGTISRLVLRTRKEILNVINRSDYRLRSAMTDAQRQALLDELRAVRFEDGVPLDGGELDRISWTIHPLTDARKRRPARKARA